MKKMESKFYKEQKKDDRELVFSLGPYRVTSPNPDVEAFEEYHYFSSQKRIVYEKYETGIMPKGVALNTPNFRRFIQSPDKELVAKHHPFIKVILDCDPKKPNGKFSLAIIEFFSYKRIELSSSPMRRMIEILCDARAYVDTDELVKKAGFRNSAVLSASKRRLNRKINKEFGIDEPFIMGDQYKGGYHISEIFLVLKNAS